VVLLRTSPYGCVRLGSMTVTPHAFCMHLLSGLGICHVGNRQRLGLWHVPVVSLVSRGCGISRVTLATYGDWGCGMSQLGHGFPGLWYLPGPLVPMWVTGIVVSPRSHMRMSAGAAPSGVLAAYPVGRPPSLPRLVYSWCGVFWCLVISRD
jgi:hypothetical protein